jgi:uncharacterized protein (TIGR03437 family)
MFNRNVTLAAAVCVAASVAAFGQAGAGYVFQIPGSNTTNSQIVGYPYAANPLAPSINTLGPNGTYQIVAKPDGTGYYILGATLQIANPTFTTFTSVNGIAATPKALAASPDGNYAVVGAGDLYVLSASTYQVLLDTTTGGTVVGIAISQDSQNAYVLTNAPNGSLVTQINLTTRAKVGSPLQLTGGATSIALSPLGLLYVGAVNRLFEIDPTTLTVTPNGTMTPNATPGPLHFTPDGTTLYFANTTSSAAGGSGGPIVQVVLATYALTSLAVTSGSSPVPVDDVIVAGNSRVFAISYALTTLFDVSTSPLGLSVSSLNNVLNNQAQNVLAAAVSNELPSAVYLYLVIASSGGQNSLYRITLATNQVSTQVNAVESGGILEFVSVPPTSGAGSFVQFNSTQTVAQSATSLPLIAQVLDLTGRPIFDLPVSFTTPSGNGIVINTPSPTTNANGYVQTTITAPAVQGTYTITLTAGTANTAFTINVPNPGGTGPTGPTGVNQITIVSGNGQLVASNFSTSVGCLGDLLTVLVTDVNGVPLPGQSVSFSVTSGTGAVSPQYPCTNSTINTPAGTTDANGLAYASFSAFLPAGQYDFEEDSVAAVSAFGTATFTEIEYAFNPNRSVQEFPPSITLLTPTIDTSRTVTVAQGSVAQNAVTAQIFAGSVPQLNCPNSSSTICPIPGVSIRITSDAQALTSSPYASCQGSTLSDQTGTAHCSVVAACSVITGPPVAFATPGTPAKLTSPVTPGSYPVFFTVGDAESYQGTIIISPGSGQNLAAVSGYPTSGPVGQTLQFPLVAVVTDGCGNPVTGAQVSWAVTQGSATLTKVTSISGSSGQVSAYVTFGASPGNVQVTATFGSSSVVNFALTSQAVVSTMTILNGNNQSVTVGNAFPQSLTVQIKDTSNNPIPNVTVGFSVTSGNGSVNPTSAVTDSQGRASTIATAAQSTGPLVVTATYLSVSVSFSLTVIAQGPVVSSANLQNSASFQTGLVPCGLATATGSGLAPGITGTVSGASFLGPLQDSLNGLSLSVNGTPAPIYQLSNTNGKQQVTFQTPCEAAPGNNGTVVIQLNGATSTVTGVTILPVQPGIFYSTGSNGTAYGEVIDSKGNYVTTLNPAIRGNNFYLIATGLGQTTPPTATNSTGVNGQNVALPVIVGVSNLGVPVFEAIYQPGAVGIYVVGFTIPLTNPAGVDQPLVIGVTSNGQLIFSNTVYLNSVQ